jgi:hypothetical protein
MDFLSSGKGYASISVDASKDKRGIWWALIRRYVSGSMNLNLLKNPHWQLRVEARIRTSHAPRRVNLHLNTQRTTDFHSHLMEFDLPDTLQWHTISMTTRGFDAAPGDSVYGQFALMDWGLERYRVDIDYFKVDIVNVDSAGPDKGAQVPYHPPNPKPTTFACHVLVAQDGMIDAEYPDMNFRNWQSNDGRQTSDLMSVSGTQLVILHWDFAALAGRNASGAGLLELTTHSVQRSSDYKKDFGMVRIVEVLGGDPLWQRETVTYNTFFQGKPPSSVLNTQMIIDIEVREERGGRNLATIPQPVLQRLIDGRTLGLAIRPLGAINASFYSSANKNATVKAKLHFDCRPRSPAPKDSMR